MLVKNFIAVFILTFACFMVSACQGASRPQTEAPNFYKPAIEKSTIKPKIVKRYVPVPMPGQMMPLKKLSASKKRHLKGLSAVRLANRKATKQPNSAEYINAIMTFNYMPGALYQVYCAPLNITDLQLQRGEHVVSVAAGDTLRWQVSKTYSGFGNDMYEHIVLKPVESGLDNSLVITTDRRTYHLRLRATDSAYMASVKWRYPDDDGNLVQRFKSPYHKDLPATHLGVNLNKLDFNYQIQLICGVGYRDKQAPGWMPQMVFSDGKKTYIQFSKQAQEMPTLFVNNGQNDEIVNYRVEGNYYIVDRIFSDAELRSGQLKKQAIVRICHVTG